MMTSSSTTTIDNTNSSNISLTYIILSCIVVGIIILYQIYILLSLWLNINTKPIMMSQGQTLVILIICCIVITCSNYLILFMNHNKFLMAIQFFIILPLTISCNIMISRLWRICILLKPVMNIGRSIQTTTNHSSNQNDNTFSSATSSDDADDNNDKKDNDDDDWKVNDDTPAVAEAMEEGVVADIIVKTPAVSDKKKKKNSIRYYNNNKSSGEKKKKDTKVNDNTNKTYHGKIECIADQMLDILTYISNMYYDFIWLLEQCKNCCNRNHTTTSEGKCNGDAKSAISQTAQRRRRLTKGSLRPHIPIELLFWLSFVLSLPQLLLQTSCFILIIIMNASFQCYNNNIDTVTTCQRIYLVTNLFMYIGLGILLLSMCIVGILGYTTKTFPTIFNEYKSIQCIGNRYLIMILIWIPMYILLVNSTNNSNSDIIAYMWMILIIFLSINPILCIIRPKLLLVWYGKDNNKNLITTMNYNYNTKPNNTQHQNHTFGASLTTHPTTSFISPPTASSTGVSNHSPLITTISGHANRIQPNISKELISSSSNSNVIIHSSMSNNNNKNSEDNTIMNARSSDSYYNNDVTVNNASSVAPSAQQPSSGGILLSNHSRRFSELSSANINRSSQRSFGLDHLDLADLAPSSSVVTITAAEVEDIDNNNNNHQSYCGNNNPSSLLLPQPTNVPQRKQTLSSIETNGSIPIFCRRQTPLWFQKDEAEAAAKRQISSNTTYPKFMEFAPSSSTNKDNCNNVTFSHINPSVDDNSGVNRSYHNHQQPNNNNNNVSFFNSTAMNDLLDSTNSKFDDSTAHMGSTNYQQNNYEPSQSRNIHHNHNKKSNIKPIKLHFNEPIPSKVLHEMIQYKIILENVIESSISGIQMTKDELKTLKQTGIHLGHICERFVIVDENDNNNNNTNNDHDNHNKKNDVDDNNRRIGYNLDGILLGSSSINDHQTKNIECSEPKSITGLIRGKTLAWFAGGGGGGGGGGTPPASAINNNNTTRINETIQSTPTGTDLSYTRKRRPSIASITNFYSSQRNSFIHR